MTKQKYLVTSIQAWMDVHDKTPDDMARMFGIGRATWFRWMKDPGKLRMQQIEMIERRTKIKLLEGGQT